MRDDTSPRKPHDPPWRGRTAHRSCDPLAARILEIARRRHGWTISEASRRTGVSRRMIKLLETAQRRPSVSLLEALIAGYRMEGHVADAVRLIAIPGAGRDSPYRRGWRPDPDDYQQGGQPVPGPRKNAPEARPRCPEPASWDEAYTPAADSDPDGDPNPWAEVYGSPPAADSRKRLSDLRRAAQLLERAQP